MESHVPGTETPQARAVRVFRKTFGGEPDLVVRAPGRVNLIGEHTDYNEGFVMPLAIDLGAVMAVRRRADRRVVLRAMEFNETVTFDLSAPGTPGRAWIDHVKGVAWALSDAGYALCGVDGVLTSDVPIGSGLSSSAAVEVAAARALCATSGYPWDALVGAEAAQRAENGWIGVSCGIMDPLISAVGVAGHAVLIDCRTLERRAVAIPRSAMVVVLDTFTRRQLVGSAYNERQRQCAAAAAACGVRVLRDLDEATLGVCRGVIGDIAFRRARHVVTENRRALEAAEALAGGDARAAGRLMDASHQSLRDDFEVSTRALDVMVESARKAPGCLGARLTGAGFGGCVVALVERATVREFCVEAETRYTAATGLAPRVYACEPAAGAEILAVP